MHAVNYIIVFASKSNLRCLLKVHSQGWLKKESLARFLYREKALLVSSNENLLITIITPHCKDSEECFGPESGSRQPARLKKIRDILS
jgi:hypothetical protein